MESPDYSDRYAKEKELLRLIDMRNDVLLRQQQNVLNMSLDAGDRLIAQQAALEVAKGNGGKS